MEHIPEISQVQALLNEVSDLSFLEDGGFKAVYKGIIDGNYEAIKVAVLPTDLGDENQREEQVGRLLREVSSLNSLKSKYVVKLGKMLPRLVTIKPYDYFVYSEEFLDGQNLSLRVMSGYCPEFSEIRQLSLVLLQVISELKSKSIIHRDIKPENIISLSDRKRLFVILDLGIAFKTQGTALTANTLQAPGTLPYMAPEMFNQGFRGTLDYRSDLYSAGLTIYEYSSGKHPYYVRGENRLMTMYRIANTTPPPLVDSRSDLPIGFCKIIDQMIKKRPALRPARLDILINQIKEF
ncbi:MAG: serine/threonine protein kinase [SAR324 cluster bacterium]|nr:serine/threonine protein kinase [SAR324 cluster bacterium]